MKNALLAFCFCLFALAAHPALSADAPSAAENPAPTCTLKNTEFCGEWEEVSDRLSITMFGNRIEDKSGCYSECSIIYEEHRGEKIFSVLKCADFWPNGELNSENFVMLAHEDEEDPEFERMEYMTSFSLPCLFGGWDYAKSHKSFNKEWGCRGISHTPYARHIQAKTLP